LFTATLIAGGGLETILDETADRLAADRSIGELTHLSWIEADAAVDLTFSPAGDAAQNRCANLAETIWQRAVTVASERGRPELALDVVVQPAGHRRKRLLVSDMDSTMITVECVDELADYARLKAEVAEITERAMRGELDFEAALDARVALLKGVDAAMIDRCRAERVRLMPGAMTLVRTMKARGATCILVSGGFTRFAEPVAEEIGFDRVVANVLEIAGGELTGRVRRPIVGAAAKRQVLLDSAAELGVAAGETLAIGDGANDIPMIEAAGLGVAFRAKPAAVAAADAAIRHGDLTALLYAQGIPRREWVEA